MYTESLAKLSLSYWKESRALSPASPPLPSAAWFLWREHRLAVVSNTVNCLLSNVICYILLGWNHHYEKATGPDKCLFISELHILLIKHTLTTYAHIKAQCSYINISVSVCVWRCITLVFGCFSPLIVSVGEISLVFFLTLFLSPSLSLTHKYVLWNTRG